MALNNRRYLFKLKIYKNMNILEKEYTIDKSAFGPIEPEGLSTPRTFLDVIDKYTVNFNSKEDIYSDLKARGYISNAALDDDSSFVLTPTYMYRKQEILLPVALSDNKELLDFTSVNHSKVAKQSRLFNKYFNEFNEYMSNPNFLDFISDQQYITKSALKDYKLFCANLRQIYYLERHLTEYKVLRNFILAKNIYNSGYTTFDFSPKELNALPKNSSDCKKIVNNNEFGTVEIDVPFDEEESYKMSISELFNTYTLDELESLGFDLNILMDSSKILTYGRLRETK